MKILFVAQNLQMGGIQKALVNTLKELAEENDTVELFTFGDGRLQSDVPKSIKIHQGNLLLRLVSTPFAEVRNNKNFFHVFLRILCILFVRIIGSKKFYRDLFKMQAELGNFDVAISYFNDIPNSYFNRGTNQYVEEFIKAPIKVAWVHTDPEKAMFNYEECVEIYRSFDKIICVSEACKKKFAEFLPQYEAKTGVVYNIFPVNEIKEMATEYIPFNHNGLINLVSVGRIDNKTKRFNLIPEICKRLSNFGMTNFYWRIVGSGPDLESNRKLVTELEVGDYVEFVGERTNPYPFIKSSHLFVLTSAYEGFPMVIGESLLLETPVLTTNYAAVNEQVKMGVNGIVVDQDIDSIVSGLRQLLTNQELIERMAEGMKEHPFTNRIANTQLKHAIGGSDE